MNQPPPPPYEGSPEDDVLFLFGDPLETDHELSVDFSAQLAPGEPATDERATWAARAFPAMRHLDAWVLLAIVVVVAIVRFARLGSPHGIIPLDEQHYVPDARDLLRFGTESDTRAGDSAFVVHPPVAKWFIGAGMRIFGDNPFGWRFFGALVGVLSVVAIYFLARRLWASPWWAATAALLLGVEGLWFVQSRVAMLDIYAGFFVLLGVWLLLEDHARGGPGFPRPWVRWWRLGAGVAFGFALATKWAAIPFVAAAIVMALVWEVGRARAEGPRKWSRLRIPSFAAVFLLVPVAVYVASYMPWFLDGGGCGAKACRYVPPRCVATSGVLNQWLCYQKEMLDFHQHLSKFNDPKAATDNPSASGTSSKTDASVSPNPTVTAKVRTPAHPYFGDGASWPWIGRPVSHYYQATGKGASEQRAEVLGLPNPVIWWPAFFLALPILAWWTIRRRDRAAPILFTFIVAGFLPYLLADLVDRPVFLFYATPLVPFLVCAVVHGLVRAQARWRAVRGVAIGYVAIAVISFAFFYPVLSGLSIPANGVGGWSGRIWLTADCTPDDRIRLFCWI